MSSIPGRAATSLVSLAVSVGLHALLVVSVVFAGSLPLAEARVSQHPRDAWAGDTFEVAMAGPEAVPLPSQPEATAAAAAEPASKATKPEPAPVATAEPQAAEPVVEPPRREAKRKPQKRRARSKAARKQSKPKPEAKAEPRASAERDAPAQERDAARASEPGGEGEGNDSRGRGKLGAADTKAGMRQLPVALTRVLPRAAVGDRRFSQSALGELGEVRFTLHLDDAGKIARTEFDGAPAALLRSLVERAVRFLGQGQFALSESDSAGAGVQRVVVSAELSQGTPTEDSDDPQATRSLGFEPPGRGTTKGVGYFELESGLRLTLKVEFPRGN